MTPSAPPRQIADVLITSLAVVFDSLCTERYGRPISLTHVVDEERLPCTVRFRLHREAFPPLLVDFTIRPVGGTVYDVQGTVENGCTRTFTYCLPEASPPARPQAPSLARAVATFLLDALERRLGADFLRAALAAPPSNPGSASSPSRR